MTKEKIIGVLLLIIGILAFTDALGPIDFFAFHIRPFLFPIFAITSGWLVLHGPDPLHKRAHHSHVLGLLALAVVIVALMHYLRDHHHQ